MKANLVQMKIHLFWLFIELAFSANAQNGYYCDFTLSTPENEDKVQFEIFPNPSTGSFIIRAEGEYTVAIYTLDGLKVFESAALFGQASIQTDLVNGTYLLVTNQGGK
tara:strand:+ start:3251 stop:3574 length:324 start_codon:yes stop_codon:yes gene_type:complete